jgi:amino acid transporter
MYFKISYLFFIKLFVLLFIIDSFIFLILFIKTIGSSFQKYLIIITLIIFIICLIIIIVSIHKSNSSQTWPSDIPQCPDYFKVEESNANGAICNNIHKLGSEQCFGTTNFSKGIFTGNNGLCNKYRWSNKCNIFWDGVNYGVSNPCNTDDDTTDTTT